MTKQNVFKIGVGAKDTQNTNKSENRQRTNSRFQRRPMNNNKSHQKNKFIKKQNQRPFQRRQNKGFDNRNRSQSNRNNNRSDSKRPYQKRSSSNHSNYAKKDNYQNNQNKDKFNRNSNRGKFERNDSRGKFDRNDSKGKFQRNQNRGKYDRNQNKDNFNNRSQNVEKNQDKGKYYKKQYTKKQQNQQKNNETQNKSGQNKQKSDKKPSIKHNRMIIRNLVFDINQKHIQKLLAPYGKILEVNIPKNPDNKGSRGFAFVEFENRNNCLKAIKELNGTKYKGRNIILDESVSKQRFMESKINQQEKNSQDKKIQQEKQENIKIEAKKQAENQNQENQFKNQQDNQNQNQQDSDDNQNQQSNNGKTTFKKQKTQVQIKQDLDSEIFIRNLPISVKQQELHQFFRKYGKIKFAKVVMNKQLGVSRGTAFVKFQDPVKAKQLIEYSKSYEMSLLGKNANFKQNPAINLQLQGTILKVFPVESRQNVSQKIKYRDAKDKQRQQQKDKKKKPIKKVKNLEKLVQYDPNNKRNLKLALLGLNQVTDDMKEQDVERFTTHERQKIEKLKNPNNSVSDRRIVFKYLKKEITQQDIRNLCFSFLQENKLKQKDLTYCKLMFESLQTKKSAGFAFVEFRTHEISLSFLQWINQQSSKLMSQPFICEFAIQDSRKMIKLQNRNQKKQKPNQKKK